MRKLWAVTTKARSAREPSEPKRLPSVGTLNDGVAPLATPAVTVSPHHARGSTVGAYLGRCNGGLVGKHRRFRCSGEGWIRQGGASFFAGEGDGGAAWEDAAGLYRPDSHTHRSGTLAAGTVSFLPPGSRRMGAPCSRQPRATDWVTPNVWAIARHPVMMVMPDASFPYVTAYTVPRSYPDNPPPIEASGTP